MIRNFNELERLLAQKDVTPCIGVVCAHDLHTLEAVKRAVEQELIRAVLIGDAQSITRYCEELQMDRSRIEIVDVKTDAQCAETGVRMVHEQKIQVLMKGKIQTKDFLKAVVNSETGIRNSPLLSHAAIHELPSYHKLLMITDGGMVTSPDLIQKKAIVMNAVSAFKRLGYDQVKVAALAAVEVVNPRMQETIDAAELKKMHIPGAVIEGPISYDLTFSSESAKIKGYESPVTEHADVLLVPDIAAGNIFSKALIYSAGAKMAGMIVGAEVPIVLTSRGASAEEKYYSIVLATLCR